MVRFNRILVHIDTRRDNHPSLERAAELARLHGSQLTLLDVVPDFSWLDRLIHGDREPLREKLTNEKRGKLKELRQDLQQRGLAASSVVRTAPTSAALIEEATQGEYDLVIKETKGRDSRRGGFLGTTANRLLRACPCAVLLVRPTGDGDWRRIVAAVDTTADDETNRTLNERIVDLALAFTTGRESQLEVVNAWIVYGEHLLREHMREAEFEEVGLQAKVHAERKLNELAMKFGMSIEDDCVKALHGDACEVIPATVNDPPADLLVMGTVGRSGISGLLLGNTAERILEKVDCSVLAVKPALSGVTQLTLAGASGVAAASAGAE